jgi:hypothetical protein
MSKLIEELKIFNGAEGYTLQDKIDDLNKKFKEIAKIMLCEGHFEFGEKKVYIQDVEFYYHEEDKEDSERVADPIMYHVNEKAPENKKGKDKDRYDNKKYFEVGTFNFHISGVDLTFEKEGKFRASMLIRGFCEDDPNGDYDGRSTYFYDYFDFVSPFDNKKSVIWKEDEEPYRNKSEIKQTYRKNVPLYRKKHTLKMELCPDYLNEGRNAYEPIPWEDKDKMTFPEGIEIKQTQNSKKIQDTIHLWRFKRNVNDTNE